MFSFLAVGNWFIVRSQDFPGIKSFTSLKTFKDLNYKQPSTKFASGEIVYIKFTSTSDGSSFSKIVLLDNKKNEVIKLKINEIDNQSSQYSTKFTAPEVSGQYILSISMKSKGNSFSYQQNIEITERKSDYMISNIAVDKTGNTKEESVLAGLLNKLKMILQKIKFDIIRKA